MNNEKNACSLFVTLNVDVNANCEQFVQPVIMGLRPRQAKKSQASFQIIQVSSEALI